MRPTTSIPMGISINITGMLPISYAILATVFQNNEKSLVKKERVVSNTLDLISLVSNVYLQYYQPSCGDNGVL